MLELLAIGILGKLPELKYSKENKPYTNFSLSCRAEMEEHNIWIDCVAFGKSAENICKFAHKGARFCVSGTPEPNCYNAQSGEHVKKIKIKVRNWEIVSGKPKENGEDASMPSSEAANTRRAQSPGTNYQSDNYANDEDVPF